MLEAPTPGARRMRQGINTMACITVLLSMTNGMELGAQEWCDALFLCYYIDPPVLQTHCDGCNAKISICHSLDCKKSGLVTIHHNKLCDGVSDFSGKAFIPSHVRNNPLINLCCAIREGRAQYAVYPPKNPTETTEKSEQKGDILIRELWKGGTYSIHDIRVMNTDALPHWKKSPDKCLQKSEKYNKKKYLDSWFQQRHHFSPFFVSVDVLLDAEAEATFKRIARRLAT